MKNHSVTIWNESSINTAIVLIKQLPTDGSMVVVLKKREEDRTLAQNRLMWMWLGILSGELGYTKNEMHDVMCREILGTELRKGLDGTDFEIIKTTRKLKIREMTDFLKTLDFTAGGLGIHLPYPADIYYKAMGLA